MGTFSYFRVALLAAVALALAGCGRAPGTGGEADAGGASDAQQTQAANEAAAALNAIAEKYYDDYLALNPWTATAQGDHRFDLRDFHREVLSDGAVPMKVLEAKVGRWVDARK